MFFLLQPKENSRLDDMIWYDMENLLLHCTEISRYTETSHGQPGRLPSYNKAAHPVCSDFELLYTKEKKKNTTAGICHLNNNSEHLKGLWKRWHKSFKFSSSFFFYLSNLNKVFFIWWVFQPTWSLTAPLCYFSSTTHQLALKLKNWKKNQVCWLNISLIQRNSLTACFL